MRSSLLAGLIGLALHGPALADHPSKPATSAQTVSAQPQSKDFNWSGFYAGGSFGGTLIKSHLTIFQVSYIEKDAGIGRHNNYGFHAGYLHQFDNNWVVGAELGYDLPNVRSTRYIKIPTNISPNQFRTRYVTGDDLLTSTVRIGYALGSWLPYAKLGYANSSNELLFYDRTLNHVSIFPMKTRSLGWVGGIGLDHAFGEHLILGLEYSMAPFETSKRTISTTAVNPASPGQYYTGGSAKYDYALHSLMMRLSYKF
jgi:opacity protein-like surface antigen